MPVSQCKHRFWSTVYNQIHYTVDCVETYLFHVCDQRRVLPECKCDIEVRERLSVVTLEWSEIVGAFITPQTPW